MFDTEQEYQGKTYKFDIDSSPQVFLLFDKIYPILDLAIEFWNKRRMNIEPKISRNF